MEARGFRYVNLDLPGTGATVVGDAHRLPFGDRRFSMIIAADSLEHFPEPSQALNEVHRVLDSSGRFVVWVPFMHPFHGDDFYRYSPLGIRYLFQKAELEIDVFEAPLWLFTFVGQIGVRALTLVHLSQAERTIERGAARLDRLTVGFRGPNMSYASHYLVVATRRGKT